MDNVSHVYCMCRECVRDRQRSADLRDVFDRLAMIWDNPLEPSPSPWPWWF